MSAVWNTSPNGEARAERLLRKAVNEAQTHSQGCKEHYGAIYRRNLEETIGSLCKDKIRETEGLEYHWIDHPDFGHIAVGVEHIDEPEDRTPTSKPIFGVTEIVQEGRPIYHRLPQDVIDEIGDMVSPLITAARISAALSHAESEAA